MCIYGNVTSETGLPCKADSGGPLIVKENGRLVSLILTFVCKANLKVSYLNNEISKYLNILIIIIIMIMIFF